MVNQIIIDQATRTISAFDNPILTALSVALDSLTYPLLFILVLWLVFFKFKKIVHEREKVLLSILILVLTVQFVKYVLPFQRPCFVDVSSKIDCPLDSAFPSGHAAMTSLFILPLLSSALFIPYLIFTIFIAFSRVYLGVHSILDVSAGLMFGMTAYLTAMRLLSKEIKTSSRNEWSRQLTHIFFGVFSIAVIAILNSTIFYWREFASISFFFFALLLVAIVYLINHAIYPPFIGRHLKKVSHRDFFVGEAAVWYALGVLLLLTFLTDFRQIVGSLLILTLGDSASTMFAASAWKRTFFKNKTIGSFFAFIIASLPAAIFLGFAAIPLIVLCAIVESVYLRIDDNFLIPAACVLYFLFV